MESLLALSLYLKRKHRPSELILLLGNLMLLHQHLLLWGFDISPGQKCSSRIVSEAWELKT